MIDALIICFVCLFVQFVALCVIYIKTVKFILVTRKCKYIYYYL